MADILLYCTKRKVVRPVYRTSVRKGLKRMLFETSERFALFSLKVSFRGSVKVGERNT